MNEKFSTNTFHAMAMELCDEANEDSKISERNLTNLFWEELELMCKNDELRRIQINAPVRLGKSTTACALGVEMYKHKKIYKNAKGDFNINNISRDQQEFATKIRNPLMVNTVEVVDENNAMAETGENSSIEKALQETFSDVQAGRYIDEIRCQPVGLGDKNIQLMLECQAKSYNEELGHFTHCYIYWRMFKANEEHIVLLGHVNISVENIIENWLKVKDIFFKFHERTQKEEKLISDWRKKDWYIEYMCKKYEKMDLMTKEGIFNDRELDYAGGILQVLKHLVPLVKVSTIRNDLVNKDIIGNFVRKVCSDLRIPQSIFGRAIMIDRVNGVLTSYKSLKSLNASKSIEKKKFYSEYPHLKGYTYKGMLEYQNSLITEQKGNPNGMINDLDLLKDFEEKQELLSEAIKQLSLSIEIQEGELIRYKEIKEKYQTFLS